MEEIKEERLKLIMRQTNYTKEEALNKLKNKNVLDIIKEYLKADLKVKQNKEKSINQKVMDEIRTFCDTGQILYNLKKNGNQVRPLN